MVSFKRTKFNNKKGQLNACYSKAVLLFVSKKKELVLMLFCVGFCHIINIQVLTKLGQSVWGNFDLDLGTDLTAFGLY